MIRNTLPPLASNDLLGCALKSEPRNFNATAMFVRIKLNRVGCHDQMRIRGLYVAEKNARQFVLQEIYRPRQRYSLWWLARQKIMIVGITVPLGSGPHVDEPHIPRRAVSASIRDRSAVQCD